MKVGVNGKELFISSSITMHSSFISRSGSSSQKIFIVDNLQKFITAFANTFWQTIIPNLIVIIMHALSFKDSTQNENTQFKCRLGDRMISVFNESPCVNLSGPLANTLLPSFRKFADSKDDSKQHKSNY